MKNFFPDIQYPISVLSLLSVQKGKSGQKGSGIFFIFLCPVPLLCRRGKLQVVKTAGGRGDAEKKRVRKQGTEVDALRNLPKGDPNEAEEEFFSGLIFNCT